VPNVEQDLPADEIDVADETADGKKKRKKKKKKKSAASGKKVSLKKTTLRIF